MLATIMPWVGQLSFLLSAICWAMRDIRWLRTAALWSGVLGITYNSYLALHADHATAVELWKVVAWLSLFFVINIVQTARLIVSNIEVRLTEAERRLLLGAFPMMKSRDLKRLLAAATQQTFDSGTTLVRPHEEMDRLHCVVSGFFIERTTDGVTRKIAPFNLIGEASWLLREQAQGSPSEIAAGGEGTRTLSWRYQDLDGLCEKHPSIRAAMTDGAARGMILKRQFLRNDEFAAIEPEFTPREKHLHAIAFPQHKTWEFARILSLGKPEDVRDGAALETSGRVMVIACGIVRVERTDGHYLDLGPGAFIGELGWVAPERAGKEGVTIRARGDASLVTWARKDLADLAVDAPGIFAGFVWAAARDMAIKLSLPMEYDRVLPGAKAASF